MFFKGKQGHQRIIQIQSIGNTFENKPFLEMSVVALAAIRKIWNVTI